MAVNILSTENKLEATGTIDFLKSNKQQMKLKSAINSNQDKILFKTDSATAENVQSILIQTKVSNNSVVIEVVTKTGNKLIQSLKKKNAKSMFKRFNWDVAALAGRIKVNRRDGESRVESLSKGEGNDESREYLVIDEPEVRRVPQLLRISDFNSSLMSNDKVEKSINMSSNVSI